MSGISGEVRETQEFGKRVGLAEVKVIAINPTAQEYKEILGFDLKEDSKATEYVGESKETGNPTVRIDVWVKDNNDRKDKIVFFLEQRVRVNKDGTKTQFINDVGTTSWADEEENLPSWFLKRQYRKANIGEEELYNFLKAWLGKLNFKSENVKLQVDFKKLIKGNVEELKEQMGGIYETSFAALYTVKTVDKEGEIKTYQSIYNRMFLPAYTIKYFRLVDYNKESELAKLRAKSELKPFEKFINQVTHPEHGIKDSFILGDIKDYNPDDFLVASNKAMAEDSDEY